MVSWEACLLGGEAVQLWAESLAVDPEDVRAPTHLLAEGRFDWRAVRKVPP